MTGGVSSEVPGQGAVGRLVRRILAIGLLAVVAMAVTHRALLFTEPSHEFGDYAVDALKIERARHFQQLHGNYSRFGFHHPGPAFYYVYALGEQVFYRWIPVVPAPRNAHVLASLLLQSFFFGAAVAMAADWIRRPWFVPLALAATAAHLSLAENAFVDTWPPRVLLMPFLCFTVGAASVAAGRIRDLPLTVLAACFLVHGHVAQPLFVGPMFLVAYGLAWRREGRGLLREHRLAHLASAGCIALFLVPFAIDLGAGADSNFARILEFESFHPPGKPLWKALVYFCAFFGYVKKTELFLSTWGGGRGAELGEHLAGYFAWAAILLAVTLYLRRVWRRPETAEGPFVLMLALLTAGAFLLSLAWGVMQTGRMYEFNGYFYYAILDGVLLLLCGAICGLPRPARVAAGALVGFAAAAILWSGRGEVLPGDAAINRIPLLVREAVRADPQPDATKYLLFNRDNWGHAVSIGLALERERHAFRADADWGPKFKPDGGYEPRPPDFDLRGVSIWRLLRDGPPTGVPVAEGLSVHFGPLPLDPTRAVIDAREGGSLERYTLFGIESPLGAGAWTIRPWAGLIFGAPPVSDDVAVTFWAEPRVIPGRSLGQPFEVSVNGRRVGEGGLDARGAVTVRVPAEAWNARRPVLLALHFPAAVSPRELGQSLDERTFGWRIERIVFAAVR